jgi:hypothetical protein
MTATDTDGDNMKQEPVKEIITSNDELDETVAFQDHNQPLSSGRLVIVGACMTLTSIITGWSVIMTPIMLDLLAEGLNLAENNLQWTLNSFLLPLVSRRARALWPIQAIPIFSELMYHLSHRAASPWLPVERVTSVGGKPSTRSERYGWRYGP